MSQKLNLFSDDLFLRDSHTPIIHNFLTVLSQSSGTTFPTTNLEAGRPCYRTDQLKLYVLVETLPVPRWRLLFDFNNDRTPTSLEQLTDAITAVNETMATTDSGTREWADGKFLLKGSTAKDSEKLGSKGLTELLQKGENDANVSYSHTFRYGISGGYGTHVAGGGSWGGTIWSIGKSYTGGASGSGWSKTGLYGLSWLRSGHSNASTKIGEGIYVFQAGSLVAGMGSRGGYVASNMTVGGSLYAYGNVTAYSDRTLKKNIDTIDGALAKILASRGVMYDRSDRDMGRQMGVIADEIEDQFPEVVVVTPNKGLKAVAYGNLAGAFIEGFKELHEKFMGMFKAHNTEILRLGKELEALKQQVKELTP